ncbi:MAG: hypothetical protein IKM26_00580 [Clostridia bacterium]|nr:hypothetical protein [Clostridia bacterium]MBR6786401.1 hypothetical protein [Clostridia bacterium]
MDVKELIEKAVELLTKDENLMESFKKEPIKTIEKLLNIDLPDEALESIVKGVKAKIDLDKVGDVLGKLGGLFGK